MLTCDRLLSVTFPLRQLLWLALLCVSSSLGSNSRRVTTRGNSVAPQQNKHDDKKLKGSLPVLAAAAKLALKHHTTSTTPHHVTSQQNLSARMLQGAKDRWRTPLSTHGSQPELYSLHWQALCCKPFQIC